MPTYDYHCPANGRVVERFRGARQWDTAESVRMIERAFAGSSTGTGTGAGRSTPGR